MPPRAAVKEAAGEARERSTQAAARRRRLVSIYGQHIVVLEPTVEGRDNHGKTYTVERPKTLKFHNYMCVVPPEWIDLVEDTPAYTGVGQPKTIAWEGDPLVPFNKQMPIQTIQGAIGAIPGQPRPPLVDWDSLEPDEIRERINEGVVPVRRAIGWEAAHRARPAVLLDLAEALGSGTAGPDEPAGELDVVATVASPETWGPAPAVGSVTEGAPF